MFDLQMCLVGYTLYLLKAKLTDNFVNILVAVTYLT